MPPDSSDSKRQEALAQIRVAAGLARPSRALPVVLTIVIAALWFTIFHLASYSANRSAGGHRSYIHDALTMSYLQLELVVAGVRRCAARMGRQPANLAECADIPRLSHLAATMHPRKDLGAALEDYDSVLDEPWYPSSRSTRATRRDSPSPVKRSEEPDRGFDYLGLPIVYRVDAPVPREAAGTPGSFAMRPMIVLPSELGVTEEPDGSLHSSAPLQPLIRAYLVATGGEPPASPRPFAVSSIFLRHHLEELQRVERTARITFALEWGGLLGILIIGVTICVLWRGRPTRTGGKVAITVAGVVATLLSLGSLGAFVASCYVMARFSASGLRRAERLALLEEAVVRGEVPLEVARLARGYIEQQTDDADR
jgi:hypothetical protein